MSFLNTWSTKEEVLKDLAKVSGHRVARRGHLDNGYIVIGDAPPPAKHESEEDEMQMLHQFGVAVRDRSTETEGVHLQNAPPDLQGITDMIRMVQGSDGEGDHEDRSLAQTSNCTIAISKPRKLNPNVQEFVPKSSSSSSSSLRHSKPEEKPIENIADVKSKTTSTCEINVDIENITPNVYEDLATKLKNDISNASKSNSFELKKQKNVAIATLLRLYANNNNKTTKTEPVKLITPDYYENPSPTKELENTTSVSTNTTPNPKRSSSAISESSNDVKSEPAITTNDLEKSTEKLDPAIKKSIEKVTQWMGEEEPEKRKSPAVFLNPVPFKRKEPAPTSSINKDSVQNNGKKIDQSNEYKPSKYASDLSKKYKERSKIKQKQEINMWTDLDVILKERDAIVAKKMTQQNCDRSDSRSPSD